MYPVARLFGSFNAESKSNACFEDGGMFLGPHPKDYSILGFGVSILGSFYLGKLPTPA